ncbi:hypothetical protein [Shimia sediminis]|uniref:hypothetical protein n=1 Tax=Shimia sediminis TaxID=2497945 RepID=UPI000F8D30D0|nr:hypothetical protein [Shimia sediminis]
MTEYIRKAFEEYDLEELEQIVSDYFDEVEKAAILLGGGRHDEVSPELLLTGELAIMVAADRYIGARRAEVAIDNVVSVLTE